MAGEPVSHRLWAFPQGVRRSLTLFFSRRSPLRTALVYISSPAVAFLGLVFVYLAWHDPTLYNLALTHEWVHNLEHLSFFVAAMLFWWPVTNAAPRLHKAMPYWGRILFVLAFVPPNAIAGFVIANASDVVYSYYSTVPRLWGLTALEDQAWGGGIMWLFSSEMMIDVALIMLGVMFHRERRQKANLERVRQIKVSRLRCGSPHHRPRCGRGDLEMGRSPAETQRRRGTQRTSRVCCGPVCFSLRSSAPLRLGRPVLPPASSRGAGCSRPSSSR